MYEHLRGGLRNQIPKFNIGATIIQLGNLYITSGAGLQMPFNPQADLLLAIKKDLDRKTDNVGNPIPDLSVNLEDLIWKDYKIKDWERTSNLFSTPASGDLGDTSLEVGKDSKFKLFLNKGVSSAKNFLVQNAGLLANMGMSAVNSWSTSGVEQGGFMNGVNGASNFIRNIPGVGEKASLLIGTLTTGLNVINKLGGRSIDKYQVDQNLMANMGGSYGGFSDLALRAADATGKNYGFFNGGGYGKAKRLKNEAIRQENIVSGINNTYQDQVAMAMNDANYTRYLFNQNGGWDITSARAAKFGARLERIRRITSKLQEPIEEFSEDLWEPQLFKDGGTINEEDTAEDIFLEDSWEPLLFLNGGDISTAATMSDWWKGTWSYLSGNKDSGLLESQYKPSKSKDSNTKYYYREGLNNDVIKNILGGSEYGKKDVFGQDLFYKDFNDVWNRLSAKGGRAERNTDNSHLGAYTIGIGEDDKGRYISYYDKFDWAPDGVKELFHPYEIYNRIYEDEFNTVQKALNNIDYLGSNPSGNWFFKPGIGLYNYIKDHKDGGSIKDSDIPKVEETSQKNIIPEGALHKEKHHMENAEDLTKKGIPVIDNDGVLLAEIERDEIVFTLEVTKKLEDLYHKYYDLETSKKDDLAIEAGKILVYEILYNTIDKTELISKCKEGGKLDAT